jgi:hypothetical protein
MQELAKFVTGKNKMLSFDIPALTVKRNHTSDVQQHILTMTPAERKRLGYLSAKRNTMGQSCVQLGLLL